MASVDLKDAYHLVPAAKYDRKFIRFIFENVVYEFTCMPYGLNTAPYTFTKFSIVVNANIYWYYT